MYLNIFSNFMVATGIFVVTLILSYVVFHVLRGIRNGEQHKIIKIILFVIFIPLLGGLLLICILSGLVALGLTAQAILHIAREVLELMFHFTTNNMYII